MEAAILAHTINKGLLLEGFNFSIGYLGHFDISNAMLVNILGSTGHFTVVTDGINLFGFFICFKTIYNLTGFTFAVFFL